MKFNYVFDSDTEFFKELHSGHSGAYLPNPIRGFVLSGRSVRLSSLLARTLGDLIEAGVTSEEVLQALRQLIIDCGWESEMAVLLGYRKCPSAEPPQNPDPSRQDELSGIDPIEPAA